MARCTRASRGGTRRPAGRTGGRALGRDPPGLVARDVRPRVRHPEYLRAQGTLQGVVQGVIGRYLGLQVLRGVAAGAGIRAASQEEGTGVILDLVDRGEGGLHNSVGVEVVQVVLGLT